MEREETEGQSEDNENIEKSVKDDDIEDEVNIPKEEITTLETKEPEQEPGTFQFKHN